MPLRDAIQGRPDADASYSSLSSDKAAVRSVVRTTLLEADQITLGGVPLSQLLDLHNITHTKQRNEQFDDYNVFTEREGVSAEGRVERADDLRPADLRPADLRLDDEPADKPDGPAEHIDTGTLTVRNGAEKGYVLTAKDDFGAAEWQPANNSDAVRGPASVDPGALVVFQNPRSVVPAAGLGFRDGTLRAPAVVADHLHLQNLRLGKPLEGQIIQAVGGNAVWRDSPFGPFRDAIRTEIAEARSELDQMSLQVEDNTRTGSETESRLSACIQKFQDLETEVRGLRDHKNSADTVTPETSRRLGDLEQKLDALAAELKILSSNAPDDHTDARLDELESSAVCVDDQHDDDDVTGAVATFSDGRTLKPCGVVAADGMLRAPQVVVTEELNARSMVASSAVVDEVSASTVSALGFRLSSAAASPGRVLRCIDDGGTAAWSDPEPTGISTVGDILRRSVPVFSGDGADAHLAASAAFVDDGGNLAAQSVHVRSEQALVRNGHSLVAVRGGGVLIALGAQATSVAAGEGALREASAASDAVAIGQDAAGSAEVPENVVAIGGFALSRHESPKDTVAVGHAALMHSESGRGNTALGALALWANRSGSHNTAVGKHALNRGMADTCTAVGSYALAGVEGGDSNTAIGAGAGDFIVRGRFNTSVGDGAGPDGDFSRTLALGKGARALNDGDFAIGSQEAPLVVAREASAGSLPMVNPAAYLPVTVNGTRYKLALYAP